MNDVIQTGASQGEKPGPEYVWPDGFFYRLSGDAVPPPRGLLDAMKARFHGSKAKGAEAVCPWSELTDQQRAVVVLLLLRAEKVERQRFKAGRRPLRKPRKATAAQSEALLVAYHDDAREWLAKSPERRPE